MEVRIGIVGLGRVGGAFVDGIVGAGVASLQVVAVADPGAPDIKERAARLQIRTYNDAVELLTAHHREIDILFDLTGRPDVRHQLRTFLAEHPSEMVIASEAIARLVWQLLHVDRPLPEVHTQTGY